MFTSRKAVYPGGFFLSRRMQWIVFFAAVACVGACAGVFESTFNNYLSDTHNLGADARGFLEFPRELPGFLVVVFAGLLSMLAVTHMGVTGAVVFGAGLLGIAFFGGSDYPLMVLMLMISSAGMHLLQPVSAAVVLALSEGRNAGTRMGQMGALQTAGTVIGTGSVVLFFNETTRFYAMWFGIAGVLTAAVAVLYGFLHVPSLHQPRARLVLRKRFTLYYALEFLFGARKQIFLTFGFWVLIRVYEAEATDIARLLMIAAIIGIVFKPLVGMAIDRFGERTVMIADGVMLAVVCLGYGYAETFASDAALAHRIAAMCFVADDLLFALGTSRSVYVSRLSESPQELTSTLAMGVSINHIASMVLPGLGGLIWVHLGYERVFTVAAGLALFISCVSMLLPKRRGVAVNR